MEFHGAKLLLLFGDKMVTLLRDDVPEIAFPNMWDLPGGGREGQETDVECVLRETHEELCFELPETALVWKKRYPSISAKGTHSYFFAAQLPARAAQSMLIGHEGQCWALVRPETWLASARTITAFRPRVRDALQAIQPQNG